MANVNKKAVMDWVAKNAAPFEELALDLWQHPELAYEETHAAKAQMDFLKARGFKVSQRAPEKLPTAFVAEWGDEGGPTIGTLGEFDALAGMSQAACAHQEPVTEGAPGHACGHNLIGAGTLFAACAAREALESQGIKARVRYYGCPAEEVLTGKGKMAEAGYFLDDGTDVCVSWHPADYSSVTAATMTAMVSAKFRFRGIPAHAGNAPEAGRSALDAVELMNVGANYMREHMVAQDRLHYTIIDGGQAPNIVPAHAGVWYFARAPHDAELRALWRRLAKVAAGAAMMTETEMEYELLGGCYNTLPNTTLNRVLEENLLSAPRVEFSAEETAFAREIQASLPAGLLEAARRRLPQLEGSDALLDTTPLPCFDEGQFVMGSSDVGDVANIMPVATAWLAAWPVGVPHHSWQAAACTGSSIGLKSLSLAANTLACTILDLAVSPDVIQKAKEEFRTRRAGRPYQPIKELLEQKD
ncbi:MAG: amidohydrolase [Fretibacterium sp.]|nr:amidohydrolase [Fretibacterium sp.]